MAILDEFVKPWPKGAMRGANTNISADDVSALMAWWTLAGVDLAVSEEPMDWLRPRLAHLPPPVAAATTLPDAFPATLETFHAWLAASPDLPEARWPGRRALPSGSAEPALMVVLDMPDGAGDSLLSGDAAALLDNILRAMGVARDHVYFSSLSLSRPAGGILDAQVLPPLAARMAHHMGLVRPKAALLLGDKTSRALVPASSSPSSRFLPAINHASGTVPAVATYHPALMLHQPMAKAECWRALQNLLSEGSAL